MKGYALCVLDYEFQILDNAFLVHKPGIKTLKKDPQRAMLSSKTNALIKKESDIDELNNSDHDSEVNKLLKKPIIRLTLGHTKFWSQRDSTMNI
uniref:Uncharacterized protein n=1 Tax=Timema tahoe TaxID=61484 RepID=A0A7R9NYN8_9NEOP|nr:unnamed protein product [Timema tahoe]